MIKKDFYHHINFLQQWKIDKDKDMYLKKYLIHLYLEQFQFIMEAIESDIKQKIEYMINLDFSNGLIFFKYQKIYIKIINLKI